MGHNSSRGFNYSKYGIKKVLLFFNNKSWKNHSRKKSLVKKITREKHLWKNHSWNNLLHFTREKKWEKITREKHDKYVKKSLVRFAHSLNSWKLIFFHILGWSIIDLPMHEWHLRPDQLCLLRWIKFHFVEHCQFIMATLETTWHAKTYPSYNFDTYCLLRHLFLFGLDAVLCWTCGHWNGTSDHCFGYSCLLNWSHVEK